MAKKEFKNLNRHKIEDTIKSIKMDDNTEEIISSAINNPSIENINASIKIIDSDIFLSRENKKELQEMLERYYFELYSKDVDTEDYYTLKEEAIYFAKMTNESFVLMAQRLKIIRDKELYKNDGYLFFKDFLDNEIKLNKSTINRYINIIENYEVATLQPGIEHSKLIPSLPILKLNISDEKKEEIKEMFLNGSRNLSARELQKKADEIKDQILEDYEDIKIKKNQKTESKYWDKLFNDLDVKKIKPQNDNDIELIKKIINHLNKFIG